MLWLWIGFFTLILLLLALDLGVFNREAHVIGVREALGWTLFWIAISLVFNGFVWLAYDNHWFGIGLDPDTGQAVMSGGTAALKFFTGYIVEKSLSVDNIFVIALIFGYFKVPAQYQHRVLFWGILGALVFRGALIGVGAVLVQNFDWVFYVFGAFLAFAALKMFFAGEEDVDPEKGWVLRWARRILPISKGYEGERFISKTSERFAFTPMFLVLIVIEATDVLFAFDSIPAIFAITTDPFIVLTSNMFAILGLRSLYFVLAGMMDRFKYLNIALAVILLLIAVKLMLHEVEAIHHLPEWVSPAIICFILTVGIVLSIVIDPEAKDDPETKHDTGKPAQPLEETSAD